MTLGELNELSEMQVDWRTDPAVAALPDHGDGLRRLLELAQGSAVLAVCDGDVAQRLVDEIATDAGFATDLRTYADTVQRNGWTPAPDTAGTIAWARAVATLRVALSEPVLDLVVKQDSSRRNLQALVDAGAVQDFADFVTNSNAMLSAENGSEVVSYLNLRAEGDPTAYIGRIPTVRNLHHFEKAALDALAANAADTSRARPLVLVLHAGIDHNGAFHRDPMMTQVVRNRRNNTLIVEGAATLADAGRSVTDLAARYGRGTPPRAQQIMLAGHGNTRVTELAGTVDPATARITEQAVDLDGPHVAETLALIDTLLDNLSTDPNARIVLNGCLTSTSVPSGRITDNPADRAAVLTRLRTELRANRSLADTIRDIAGRRGYAPGQVSAANASFGSEVSLIDPRTGVLGLRSSDDPELTNADKFAYVRRAGEATGAMRAVVECLATDPARTESEMRARLTGRTARTPWDDSIIRAFYRLVLGRLDDVGFANDLSLLSGSLSEAQFRQECAPSQFVWAPDALLGAAFTPLLGDAELVRLPHLRLVMNEMLLRSSAARGPAFLEAMGGFTVNELEELVDLGVIGGSLPGLLPDPRGTHAAGELRLALLDVVRNHRSAQQHSIDYLRRLRAGDRFADPREISAALGGAGGGVSAVLDDIREPASTAPPTTGPAPSGPPVPDFNIDVDGDGRNDMYVEPMVKWGITVGSAEVRAQPNASAPVVATLPDSTSVKVIGRTEDGAFYVIEHGSGNHPHFVLAARVLAP